MSAVEMGSLEELQLHLDRRKLALSRDRHTAANILHKAVVLRHQHLARWPPDFSDITYPYHEKTSQDP
jgi:hypothetical protein